MPEVELRRDPLGANRGKSFREQANIATTKAKQHAHNKYYTPPYRPSNRNWEMTFAALGYNRKTIEKFWRIFCQINHSSGAIQLEHFLKHFDLNWDPWTERCFDHFDTTGGGDIDFLEFMISVFNVCTFKIDSLSNFAFDMYDLDSDGELSIPEIERMVKELFGEGGGKQCLDSAIEFAETRGGALNLNSFIAFTGSHQLLLFPMFQLQRQLQKKVFGVKFWEKIEKKAKENFNIDEHNKNEFNPRHVQILLRTYQTGGAVAVLSHTGDPNKGLREWYANQKDKDTNDEEAPPSTEDEQKSTSRWSSIREKVNAKSKATQQWGNVRKSILEANAVEKMKDLKPKASFRRKRADRVAISDVPGESDSPQKAVNPPDKIVEDLRRIRARQQAEAGRNDQQQQQPHQDDTGTKQASVSTIPPNVAEDLRRIRERRTRKATRGKDDRPASSKSKGSSRRSKGSSTSSKKRRERDRRRRRARAKSTAAPVQHHSTRRRTAGSMFHQSGAVASREWLG